MFWADKTFKQSSVPFSSNILAVPSLKATAKKFERILPFYIGEKSKATTSDSTEVWAVSLKEPVWSSS